MRLDFARSIRGQGISASAAVVTVLKVTPMASKWRLPLMSGMMKPCSSIGIHPVWFYGNSTVTR